MPDANELPALSEAQWEIMNLIWDRTTCSVADLWKVLNKRRGIARNTVQTLIVRLEEKGWLTHREEGGAFLYLPTVSREESQESSVRRFIKTVFEGSSEGLVLTLLNGGAISKAEADRVRKLIDSASRKER
jgi:BlaI family penicillinase repressor